MKPERRWRQTVRTGLLWGAAAVFIALVGLVEALQQRQIITGGCSGGHLLLLVGALGAGISAARKHAGTGTVRQLAAAALAGAIRGWLPAILVALSTVVNLRSMLVGATPQLFAVLSFARGTDALPWIVLVVAGVSALGGALTLLPGEVRSLVTTGISTLLVVGLMQEQVQLLLQTERTARIREVLFTFDGLTVRGAGLVAVVGAGFSSAWHRQRSKAARRG